MKTNKYSDLKDLGLILVGFVLFVIPMILVLAEGIRCAYFAK